MTTAALDAPTITYSPRGSARDIFALRVPELLLSGPAGTGKSRALLEKVHLACLRHPGMRALMVRKTRRSLTESGMVTYWTKVVHPADGVLWRPSEQQYQYRNGSVLAVGGMDKPQKIMSSEWDLCYVQEATELNENDWEAITTRLRNGKNSYQQLLGDCNPEAPTHWLRQRAASGRLLMLESRHEDNPVLFDENGVMTAEGERYLAVLDSLTGVRYARLRLGQWAAAEGMVYENAWDRSRNMIDRSPIPQEYPRYLAIDFGYTNPFVCQWYAVDPDGRLIRYREIYKTKMLVEDHCQSIALASGWYHLLPKSHPRYRQRPSDTADPLPRAIICDHDAEDRATFERHLGLYTTAAKKTVSDGIQAVSARLRPAGDSRPRLSFMRDALVERDRDLADRKKPTCFEEEIDSYVWKMGSSGMKEEPVKEDDHAQDSTRYMVAHLDLQSNDVAYVKSFWR